MKERYNVLAILDELHSCQDKERKRRLRQLLAVNIGDRTVLAELLGLSSPELDEFYPDMAATTLTTSDTIDAFLERFGGGVPQEEETAPMPEAVESVKKEPEQPVIPVAPAIDYATAFLSDEEPEEENMHKLMNEEDSRIDSFLKSVPPPTPRREGGVKTEETPALTESFAKIMIKNGNYSKALEIISELNLKKPEKSIYFADQIRFLRKLVRNQELLKRGKNG